MEEIYRSVAKETGFEYNVVRFTVINFWKQIQSEIVNPTRLYINIAGWGKFFPSFIKLEKTIRRNIWKIRTRRDFGLDTTIQEETIKKLWKIRRRWLEDSIKRGTDPRRVIG